MINNLGTICSVVQKTPQQLFRNNGYLPLSQNEDLPEREVEVPIRVESQPVESEDLIDLI